MNKLKEFKEELDVFSALLKLGKLKEAECQRDRVIETFKEQLSPKIMNKEIKEFREKFVGKLYRGEPLKFHKYHNDWNTSINTSPDNVEKFWLSKLEENKAQIIKLIEGMKAKRYKKGDFLEHRDEFNYGYNRALEEIQNKIKQL